VSSVPPVVWVTAVVCNVVVTAASWSLARRRVRRAGQRVTDPGLAGGPKAKDTALTLASLVPAGLFWLMVLGGSLHGLVAFGRTTLGWRDGWEYLVPGTLDGVSVTFAMLAFRAVKRGKAPDRCYRVVWGAALASSTINFAHEYGKSGNILAGGYVALLSLFGMFMFDEFLNQFEQGTGSVRRQNPKFGIRWLTWPSNTFLAAVAWRNHPPAEGMAGTVANAVVNLERVRAAKRDTRRGADPRRAARLRAVPIDSVPGGHSLPVLAGSDVVVPRGRGPMMQIDTGARRGGAAREEVKVPSTSATVTRWVQTWVAMCQLPAVAAAALQDDQQAREHFGCSSRQLRHIRYAATSGALRYRAQELAVTLPDGFDTTMEAPATGGAG
jgi:hypothetical protein